MLLCAWLLLRHRAVIETQEKVALWSYLLLPVAAMTVQIFSYGVVFLSLANTISLVVIFLFSQAEQGRRTAKRERELAQKNLELSDSRVKLLLGQIQPHFIFNSLLAIQELCQENPTKAATAVQDFSRYLRGNLDAMSTTDLIPFEQELSHIRHYLALEQVDPASRIRVRYQLETTDFRVPALSVQPIVENAVRHGIGTRSSGGTVCISTREDAASFVITVEDDGVGFAAATPQQEERRSVGIENVRVRLHAQCDGSLKIETGEQGTVVTIAIPKAGN
jgi:two-component system LytT family sensor kinase